MPSFEIKIMKKNEWILAAAVLLLAALSGAAYYFISSGGDAAVQIVEAGTVIQEYPLKEDRIVLLGNEDADYNILEIKDGKASMIEADCPDELCVRQKPVSRPGESIVCVPHKLVIQITGNAQGGYDGFVQ